MTETKTKTDDPLISRKEAVWISGISYNHFNVYDCTRRYDLKPEKDANGRVFYRRSVIQKFKEAYKKKRR